MSPRRVPPGFWVALAVLLLAAAILVFTSSADAAVVAPANFIIDSYAPNANLSTPTCMAFFSDGRLLVGEKRGRLWIIQNGVKSPTPVLAIDNEVLDDNDRGLLCVAIDPNFATNRYIYLLYTVDPDTNGVDTNLEAFGRLTRYTLNASNVADPASRTILMGVNWAQGVPIGSPSHSIGSLRWGRDGSLLVSCGDGADFNSMDPGGHYPNLFLAGRADPYEDIGAFRAQSLSSLAGKVLRLNPATGGGYPSNPYWDGNAFSKRSRIWEYGLRNPFRIQVRPNTGSTDPAAGSPGTLYIGDVGWNTWEELNVARTGGMNFGWPCYEGRLTQTQYQAATPAHNGCSSVGTPDNPTTPTLPPLAWSHTNANASTPPGYTGNTSTGGVFYTGTQYPGQYRGAMFFCDYGQNWIRVGTFDANDQFVSMQPFATEALGPVDMATDPISGDIFYVAINSNDILRIRYTGATGNAAPVVVVSGTPEVGPTPLAVQFSSSGTFDPDGDSFSLGWDFGDGTGSTAANPAHTYTQPGTFIARLTADDHKGGVASNAVVISATGASGFPTTTVLDNFNRADGPIGSSWAGTTSSLVITAQQLTQTSGAADAVWNGGVYGATQEAFVTLNAITAGNTEHDLMLKIQGTSWSTGHIEVRYDTPGSITISTYAPTQGWITRGGPFAVTLTPGDRLGARAYPNGAVEVYRNGQVVATASSGNWPFAGNGGRIGMTLVGATQSRLDSFGGGDAVLDPNTKPTATITSPVNNSFFYVGQNIALSGTGSDAQDPPSALTARWEVDIHHNNHIHPNSHLFSGFNATLVGENHDDGTGVYEEIRFIVTDTGGKSDTARVNIYPELDLAPSPLVLTPDPPASNATAQASFSLRDSGRMPVPITRWALVVDGTTVAQGDTIVPALDSVTIVRTLAPLGAGNHVLRVVADTLGQAYETSETNNTTTRTVTPIDLDPPRFVTGPTASPGTTTATVAWTSNESARGAVRYGLTSAFTDSMTTATGTSGSATLTGLARNTTYSYQVAITDVTELTTLSSVGTFTTLANRPPVANGTANPATGSPPLTVAFSSAGSSDPDGDPITFNWTFGDGDSITAANPSHLYAAAGNYTATLRVSDNFGASATKAFAITVGSGFPGLPVVDNFNRADGALAAPWAGELAGMRVQSNRLVQTTSGWNTVIWNGATYGADQECYVTLNALTTGSPEHDVLLKLQGTTTPTAHIEVRYDHSVGRVYIGSYSSTTGWRTHATITQTFAAGDRLGARAFANGTVDVYRNTTKIGTGSVTTWPFYTQGGRIGLTLGLATSSSLDDFGGGTIVAGPDVTPPVFTAGPSVTPQAQSATVSWTTNEATTGVVRFGLTSALGDSVTSASSTTHADVLTGLTRGTGYFYRVVARDGALNTTTSAIATFTTLANGVPVANATGSPTVGPAPLTVQFSSTGSSDPDGDPITTSWAFGDGGTSTLAAPSHAYATAATYNCILTVSDGLGGVGLDTVVVVVTPAGSGFPTTPVVDNFNRANGALGASWAGDVTRAGVAGNALALTQPDASIVYAAAAYGATQEGYVTLTSVTGIAERDLMLKVQGLSWSGGHIEVRYSPGSVTVSTYAPTGGWVTRGTFPVTMAAGDKLGARADAAGQVQVYRNATLLGTTSVGTWPFASAGGRIGLTLAGSLSAVVDDFGGGTVPGTAPAAPAMARVADDTERERIPRDQAWLSPPRPNPSARGVSFTLSLPAATTLTWSVLDLQGRRLSHESRAVEGGLTTLTWDGLVGGRHAPAGMYLAVVELDGRRLTRRFVRVE